MQALDQFIQQATHQIQTQGISNVLELERMFAEYNGKDWEGILKTTGERKKILFQDEHLKVLLIHWSGFQQSDKHGHPGEGGLIKVLSGLLLETRFDPKHPEHRIGSYLYAEGDVAYIHDDIALHTVENPLSIPAVSLHCYVLKKREKNTAGRKLTNVASNVSVGSAA